jgi:hypothetical protein
MKESKGYRDVLSDNESLAKFLRTMAKFDKAFTDLMVDGSDFTLKLEVHGNAGEMLHARVGFDSFERPRGVERRVDAKSRQGVENSI